MTRLTLPLVLVLLLLGACAGPAAQVLEAQEDKVTLLFLVRAYDAQDDLVLEQKCHGTLASYECEELVVDAGGRIEVDLKIGQLPFLGDIGVGSHAFGYSDGRAGVGLDANVGPWRWGLAYEKP